MDQRRKPAMIVIRKYKKNRSGKQFWEFTIYYKDVFTNRTKSRRRRGFMSKDQAEKAAKDLMDLLCLPAYKMK